jgi:hypothetical protein
MNIAQKYFLVLPALRSPLPHVPLFWVTNHEDCEPKPVHQGEEQRDKNWADSLLNVFFLSDSGRWLLPSAEVRLLFALLSGSRVFLCSLFWKGVSNSSQWSSCLPLWLEEGEQVPSSPISTKNHKNLRSTHEIISRCLMTRSLTGKVLTKIY